MTDRPILCAASVVRNILSGRQAQDRRPLSHPLAKAKVGDRLYVRESWQALSFGDYLPTAHQPCDLRYAATDALADVSKEVRGYPWRPSIHMPRWASRLTLVVTDVRHQRVRDISEEDARAEGCVLTAHDYKDDDILQGERPFYEALNTPLRVFERLWDSLYGHNPGVSWGDNPEVIALTFSAHRCNIDHFSDASKMVQGAAEE